MSGNSAGPSAEQASLKSLAPDFVKKNHGTYLRHLNEQVGNPKNLNIALTGRYGAGKSSILDRFEDEHRDDTVRLGISTLDPAAADSGLTNRLQKEIVKQVLYQAPAKQLRLSRFNRITRRNPVVVFAQSLAAVVAVAAVLALPGWLPHLVGTGKGHHWFPSTLIWLAFLLVISGLVMAARTWVLDRREVTNVSAAGASVSLSAKSATYFDEYLDEIVYFFDEVSPRYVIFEDLDRFEDPHIFEALRELNTLLNSTQKRRKSGVPVQFIYAIKDSLFEKLGEDPATTTGDRAIDETRRANRTKFFEVVIPVVPFISHRNARELLSDELAARNIMNVDRRLIDLVARSTTDMRLLHNICNEYLIFAERLLDSDKVAPGLNPTRLFALVAYKNFHLEDFELIARRESNLDTLYSRSRAIVTDEIAAAQKEKRALRNARIRESRLTPTAARLGDRFNVLAVGIRQHSQYSGWPFHWFKVAAKRYSTAAAKTPSFWRAVSETRAVTVVVSHSKDEGGYPILALDEAGLEAIVPEAMKPGQWDTVDSTGTQDAVDKLDQDISYLRGAGFVELVREQRLVHRSSDDAQLEGTSFAADVESVLTSVLARSLVKQGFIDRNFTLYAAQFYGHFSGVDVATFLVQSANPNVMDINYTFSGPDAIDNLLAEAPSDFTSSVAAFNIAILDHLLDTSPDKAAVVVEHMVAGDAISSAGSDAATFLAAFVNSDARPERLISSLARRGWRDVLTFVVGHTAVPDEVRTSLTNAALAAASSSSTYAVNDTVRDIIEDNYAAMPVFHEPQPQAVTRTVAVLAVDAGVQFSELVALAEPMRELVVPERRYPLTGDNLRSALNVTGEVPLDEVRQRDAVWKYCLAEPDQFLRAVADDPATPYAVIDRSILVEVLTEIVDDWSAQQLGGLLDAAAESVRLDLLSRVPDQTWPALAERHLFEVTVTNVNAYRSSLGSIDRPLAGLLADVQTIDTIEGDDQASRADAALAIIGASDALTAPELRVKIVVSLDLESYLDPTTLPVESGPLLAELLKGDVVQDSEVAFVAFKTAGWPSIELAAAASTAFSSFAGPAILTGFIPDLLTSRTIAQDVKLRALHDLTSYVPDDDAAALRAVAAFAVSGRHQLQAIDIERIARVTQDATRVVALVATAGLGADAVVQVFSFLPVPYSHFATHAQTQLEVPDDEPHRMILDVLDRAGVASHSKVRLKPRRAVRLAERV